MSDDETQVRLAEIEGRIEDLRDMIESCRKGMLASRGAIGAGGTLFVVNVLGLIGSGSLLIALLSFSAIIGGIVWLGANKTSREQALAALRIAQSEWHAAIDAIDMSPVREL
jgi:hypothetical protein